MQICRWFLFSFALVLLVLECRPTSTPVTEHKITADAIYFGGPIVTVNDAQMNAEALAVKDGKLLAQLPQLRQGGPMIPHTYGRVSALHGDAKWDLHALG